VRIFLAALFAERVGQVRQDLLIAELDHRVKNVLARVAVIAMHTRQSGHEMDEFVQALDAAFNQWRPPIRSQPERWAAWPYDLYAQLAPYTTTQIPRSAARRSCSPLRRPRRSPWYPRAGDECCEVRRPYRAGRQSVGELGSHPRRCSGDLTITWRELGGPPVTGSVQSRYGSSLIRDLILMSSAYRRPGISIGRRVLQN